METCDQVLAQPPRVLLIEDEEAVAQAIMRGLKRANLAVAWASTGLAGLAMAAAFKPDVVLLDLVLPDIKGTSLVACLHGQQDLGIIVISGTAEGAEQAASVGIGADGYIAKPPCMRDVVARIHAVSAAVRRNRRLPA